MSNHDAHCVKIWSIHTHAILTLAIDNTPDKTWCECCEMEIIELDKCGNSYFKHCKNLACWHSDFIRRNNLFPNPNNRVKDRLPPFLSNNPDAIEAINSFCRENI